MSASRLSTAPGRPPGGPAGERRVSFGVPGSMGPYAPTGHDARSGCAGVEPRCRSGAAPFNHVAD